MDKTGIGYVGVGPTLRDRYQRIMPFRSGRGARVMRSALAVPSCHRWRGRRQRCDLRRAGADGLAVVSAVCGAADRSRGAGLVSAFGRDTANR